MANNLHKYIYIRKFVYRNAHTDSAHIHTHIDITKRHIQIQKCASFNNKLHNFNLLRQKGGQQQSKSNEERNEIETMAQRPHPPQALMNTRMRDREREKESPLFALALRM